MDKVIGSILVVTLIAVALTAMVIAWRKRQRYDKRYSITRGSHQNMTNIEGPEFSVFYVATTPADQPLQRVSLPGLTYRADAHLIVSPAGLQISPRGETATFIPAQQIIQIHQAQVTIDKAVEKDGLTAISWLAFDTVTSSDVEFTSYFRISIPEVRAACERILAQTYVHNSTPSKEVSAS